MRIQIVLNSLQMGGAQRAALLVADGLETLGHSVDLIVFAPQATDFFISERTRIAQRFSRGSSARDSRPGVQGRWSARAREVRRWLSRVQDVSGLRRHNRLAQPDIAVAFESYMGVVAFPAYARSSIPLVIAERVHPAFQPVPGPVGLIRPSIMRHAAGTTAQSREIADWMVTNWGVSMPRVIPNIVREMDFRWSYGGAEPGLVVGLGRYSHQKGLDILLRAWSLLPSGSNPPARLLWFGSGDIDVYASLARELGIENQVRLLPATSDVSRELRRANAFVFPSRYEGFPNALAEALAGGVPTVVTQSPGAVTDMAAGRAVVVPAEDPERLAVGIRSLIDDRELAAMVGESGTSIVQEYSAERIVHLWHEWLMEVVSRPGGSQ